MSDKIICSQTGKEISGYDGVISVNVDFEEACRYYTFSDISIYFEKGILNYDKSFPFQVLESYDIKEFYPKISVKFLSPFSKNEENITLKNDSLENEVLSKIDPYIGLIDSDKIAENAEFPDESAKLSYYELWLPTIDGKFRGSIDLNFKDISSRDDLKNFVLSKASEDYEWHQTHPEQVIHTMKDSLIAGMYESAWAPAVHKCNLDEMDKYQFVLELGYLVRKGFVSSVISLVENNISKINENQINEAIIEDDFMIAKGYSSIRKLIECEYLNDEFFEDEGKELLKLI